MLLLFYPHVVYGDSGHALPERSTGGYQIPPSKRATVLNPRETIESVAGKIQLNRPTALHAAQASLELRELVPPGFAH